MSILGKIFTKGKKGLTDFGLEEIRVEEKRLEIRVAAKWDARRDRRTEFAAVAFRPVARGATAREHLPAWAGVADRLRACPERCRGVGDRHANERHQNEHTRTHR